MKSGINNKRRAEASSLRELFQEQLDHISTLVTHVEQQIQQKRELADQIADTTEALITGTNPNVRIVIGYKKRLRSSAVKLGDYIDCLTEVSPPIVHFDRLHYAEQPVIDAFFTNRDNMQLFFKRSRTVKHFLKSPDHKDNDKVYLLLSANLTEKSVFRSTIEGNMLRSDVRQTHVNLDNRQLLAFSLSEMDLQNALRKWMFDRIVACIRSQLNAKIKRRTEELQKMGKKVNLCHTNPDKYLAEVQTLLEAPQDLLYLYKTEVNTDRFGIKITDNDKKAARHYTLTQAHVAEKKDKAIIFASCQARDLSG